MEINKNQITIDLAKQHISDSKDSDILINDINKLIEIIEKRSLNIVFDSLKKELKKGHIDWADSENTNIRIKKTLTKIYEK